jgi:hemolysin activation/secretion protein
MKSPTSTNRKSTWVARLVSFCPVLLTLPVLAESFPLQVCPLPEILKDEQSLLLDCNQVTAPPPAALPGKPTAEQPKKSSRRAKSGTVAQSKQATGDPNPTTSPVPLPPAITTIDPPIAEIQVFGNTVLTTKELDALLLPGKGKPASREQLCKTAQAMTKVYRDRGYVLAQSFPLVDRKTQLPVKNGVVGFLNLEGCLEKLDILGTQRLKADYISSRIANGIQTPFNANVANDRLSLLQTDSKIGKLEVLGLSPGKSFGSSVLSVKITEASALSGFLGIDSFVSPAFGGTRGIAGLTYRNVTGNGDEISGVYFLTPSGEVQGGDVSYTLPVNAMNGQIQLRFAPTSSKINLDPAPPEQPNPRPFKSNSTTFDFNYRQPIVRTASEELALTLGLNWQDEQTSLNGTFQPTNGVADSQGRTNTRIVRFAQEYTSSDLGGNWSLRSQFNLGLGSLGATVNAKPQADGRFFSWQGQAQRVQRFGQDNYAIAQAEFQLTPDRLVPNQQLNIGGGQSVRGYRQNARSGDNGVRVSLEDRTVLGRDGAGQASLQLAVNADAAQLWNSNGAAIDQGFLASAGAGLIWEPLPKLVTRLDYSLPLVRLGDRGSSFQDSGVSFSVGYGF